MSESSGSGIIVRVFGRTDVGQIREHNEDNFLVADLSRRTRSLMETDREQHVGEWGTLLGVCDGMGGAAAGEIASQLAGDIIYEKLIQGSPPKKRDDLARRLGSRGRRGHAHLQRGACRSHPQGMGTTATIAALMDSRLFVAQVGDSRAYVLRGDRLVQVTAISRWSTTDRSRPTHREEAETSSTHIILRRSVRPNGAGRSHVRGLAARRPAAALLRRSLRDGPRR